MKSKIKRVGYKPNNQTEFKMLVGALEAIGVRVCEVMKRDGIVRWPYVVFRRETILERPSCTGHKSYNPELYADSVEHFSMENFLSAVSKIMSNAPVEVRLNSEYTAVLNLKDDEVLVGCQKIPVRNVEELYEAIQKAKKEEY